MVCAPVRRDNPRAIATIDRTSAQTVLYLTCTMISIIYLFIYFFFFSFFFFFIFLFVNAGPVLKMHGISSIRCFNNLGTGKNKGLWCAKVSLYFTVANLTLVSSFPYSDRRLNIA